jgi:hypothetical protein
LVANNRHSEARTILADYHAGGEQDNPLINFELDEINKALELDEHAKNTKWSALVATPGNRKRLLITCLLGFFSQWVVS